MNVALEKFGMRLPVSWINADCPAYRPPHWPPPPDWSVSIDASGKVISIYSDSSWDLSPWAGKRFRLSFGSKRHSHTIIASQNAERLKLIAVWLIWGPQAVRSANTLNCIFQPIRSIFNLCSEKGILASELIRYPKVVDEIPTIIAPSAYQHMLSVMHRLWDARDLLGFVVLDQSSISDLAECDPAHIKNQTAYIPPRIWCYQVERLRLCLEDFLSHHEEVEACFNFCIDAYIKNYGSLENAIKPKRKCDQPPFSLDPSKSNEDHEYFGKFHKTAERFKINELLSRWLVIPEEGTTVKQFTAYLSLIRNVGVAYIANFSLQRAEEVCSMRTDCLIWETDEKIGRVPILCGETTKTDPDSDARWPTSPTVEIAVKAMSIVSRLRMRCAAADVGVAPTADDQANPYLFDRVYEPWARGTSVSQYSIRPHMQSYLTLIEKPGYRLFDIEQLKITREDFQIASQITLGLANLKEFAVGEIWPLALHQLRRTGAVNMFASGLISDSTMQFLMKHASRFMPLYYGRGHTKLRLSEDTGRIVLSAMYEAAASKISNSVNERYVSPFGPERKETMVINLYSQKNFSVLKRTENKAIIGFRDIRLGICMKNGHCEYGGIESVAGCGGSRKSKPCADALFDKYKETAITEELSQLIGKSSSLDADTPRGRATRAEIVAMENYLDVVRNG